MSIPRGFKTVIEFGSVRYGGESQTLVGDTLVRFDEDIPAGATNSYEVALDPTLLQGFVVSAASPSLDVSAGADDLLGSGTSHAQVRGWSSASGETNPITAARTALTVTNTGADPVRFQAEILLAN